MVWQYLNAAPSPSPLPFPMHAVFDIMVSAPAAVDMETFELWLRGSSVDETARVRLSKLDDGQPLSWGPDGRDGGGQGGQGESFILSLALQETQDHFRMYEMLESFLCQPMLLRQQTVCPVGPDMRRVLIEKYHALDPPVVRELLGRKLTTKFRRDLEEIRATTGVPVHSCRRQFDNLKNAYNLLDDKNFQGDICGHLERSMLLPTPQAWNYTCVLFILYHRFHIASNKKKTVR